MAHKIEVSVKPIPQGYTGEAWYVCKLEGLVEVTQVPVLKGAGRRYAKVKFPGQEPSTLLRTNLYPSPQDAERAALLYQIHYYRARIAWAEGHLTTFRTKLAKAETELAERNVEEWKLENKNNAPSTF